MRIGSTSYCENCSTRSTGVSKSAATAHQLHPQTDRHFMGPQLRMSFLLPWHDANVRQIPVPLRVVEPITHYELVRNLEAHIISLDRHFPPRRLIEQGCDLERLRLVREKQLLQKGQRQPGIQNVFYQDDILPLHRLVYVFRDAHLARGVPAMLQFMRRAWTVAVARDADEVERCIQCEVPGEVPQKD